MRQSRSRISVGTLGWETLVVDAEGVKTQPLPHTVRCVAAGSPDVSAPARNVLGLAQ